MEPRASAPHRRLDAVRALGAAGIPTGVMTAPMIPGLNDHEMEAILEAASEAGATRAGFTVLRLPLEIKDLFDEWLRANRPDRAEKVLPLIRQMRGGALYQAEFGLRMRGEGPIAQLLAARPRRRAPGSNSLAASHPACLLPGRGRAREARGRDSRCGHQGELRIVTGRNQQVPLCQLAADCLERSHGFLLRPA